MPLQRVSQWLQREHGKMTTRKTTTTTTKKTKPTLPEGILPIDLERPKYDAKDGMVYSINNGSFTLHNTTRMGWCVATLHISRGKRGQPDRTYGARLTDGSTVTIGNGPHVLETIEVYVRKSRVKALQHLIDTHTKGMTNAGMIRDRIGSRRAQGQLMRAEGRHSWMWDR
jgi:hypothetical protein